MKRFLSARYLVVCLSRVVTHVIFLLQGRRCIVEPQLLIWPSDQGGALLAANHKSMLDILAIQAAVGKRYCHWMMKDSLLKVPIAGPFFRWHGGFPIDRGNPDSAQEALAKAVDLVRNENELVVIFPEATRRKEESIGKFPGFMVIEAAQLSGAPIIPIGMYNIRGKSKHLRHVRVRIGNPIYVPAHATQSDLIRIKKELRQALSDLSGYPFKEAVS